MKEYKCQQYLSTGWCYYPNSLQELARSVFFLVSHLYTASCLKKIKSSCTVLYECQTHSFLSFCNNFWYQTFRRELI